MPGMSHRRSSIASRSASAVVSPTSQPLRPGCAISLSPPTGVASSGRLSISASRAALGQHSHSDGMTTMCASRRRLSTSLRETGPSSAIRGSPATTSSSWPVRELPIAPVAVSPPSSVSDQSSRSSAVTARSRFCTPLRRSMRPTNSSRTGSPSTGSAPGPSSGATSLRNASGMRTPGARFAAP